ncbi:MAG TPA: hypothetical protein PKZ42_08315 [Syntrophales bacterium]|nr:hypothetical protein [Syntrophales bacterium]
MTRNKQHTASAAAFAISAELSRRGYDVAFTIGNTPRIDLLCSIPGGKSFKVQVKGISGSYGFYVQKEFFERYSEEELFLVVVLVPKDEQTSWRYFILTHEDSRNEFAKTRKTKKDGTSYTSGFGLNWGSITPYENKWDKFPIKKP